jgi:hypothetical protein
MSYEETFAAVPGVVVEWSHYLGSYQGRLICKLTVAGDEGPRYVWDYYGSCSGCDSYEAEFGFRYGDNEPTPEELAAFGKPYVDAALTLEEVLTELTPKPGDWYDIECKEALDFVLADYPEKRALFTLLPRGSA